ncbi:MAG: hypothetical protein LUQ66_01105 [Methanoregula sp.]|nr:hypothetical protein [Methanoregula sp.]
MMILNRPVMVLLALWCMAVLLVPVALADVQGGMQGPGGAGPATGGQGNTGQMQAPPSGGSGDSGSKGNNGGPGNGNGGQMSAPPSGAMGNLTAPAGAGDWQGNRNMTPPDGTGNANMTSRERPAFDAANMTATGGPGGFRGDGNMTPPDFGNMTAGNVTAHGMHGNITYRAFGNETPGNGTAPVDRPDGMQGDQNQAQQSGGQVSGQVQQSKEDVIASLINELQALLSGRE